MRAIRITSALLLAVWTFCALLFSGAALAAGSSAAAGSQTPLSPPGSSPFTPGVPQAPATTPTTSPAVTTPVTPGSSATTATSGSSSFGTGATIAVAVGAVVLIGGISFFIWRDARRRAPARAAATLGPLAGGRSHPGSKPPPRPRKLSAAERRRRKRGRARQR